ncbi:MAG: hypothetical protein PUP92_06060, partial [Rhizonema sp. PD38]|nr:hypothetical protein [Rhizonema sp. PD38]
AYSYDLRKKIINAYIERPGSYRELALKFSVSLSFVQTLINLLAPKKTDIKNRPSGDARSSLPLTLEDSLTLR